MPDAVCTIRDDLHPDRWPEVTADDEIRAAIEKLTELKSVGVMYPDKYECTVAEWRAACSLITTLHRTIDAQLHILQETIFQLSGAPESRGFIGNEFNLIMQLVTAINGTPQ